MSYSYNYELEMNTACCRVCLGKGGDFYELFSSEQLDVGATIAQILRECTSYSVELNDNLSHQICQSCLDNACFAYNFRRQADESYRYLCGIMGQPQKSTIMLCETGTQTESNDGHIMLNSADDDDKMSLVEPMNRKRPRQEQNKKQLNVTTATTVTTNCKLCGSQHDRLLDLREHLIAEHMFHELTEGLQCRLCEKAYSRKDHLVRHLRNIHKVTRDRENGSITIEQPQTSTMGQWTGSELDGTNEPSVALNKTPERDTKCQPEVASTTTTVHRYWHSPEFVRMGINTNTYKVKLAKLNNAAFKDPLTSDGTSLMDKQSIGSLLPIAKKSDVCDTKLPINGEVMDTFKSEALKRDRPKFECHICYRNFFRKYHLQRHMLIHTKVHAYNCELCKRTFARSDQILRHRKDGCKPTDLLPFEKN